MRDIHHARLARSREMGEPGLARLSTGCLHGSHNKKSAVSVSPIHSRFGAILTSAFAPASPAMSPELTNRSGRSLYSPSSNSAEAGQYVSRAFGAAAKSFWKRPRRQAFLAMHPRNFSKSGTKI